MNKLVKCDNCGKEVKQSKVAFDTYRRGDLCLNCWYRFFDQDKVTKMLRDIKHNSEYDRDNVFDGGFYG